MREERAFLRTRDVPKASFKHLRLATGTQHQQIGAFKPSFDAFYQQELRTRTKGLQVPVLLVKRARTLH